MGEPAPVLSEEEKEKRLRQLYLPEVGQWLSGIDAYTLQKPVRKRFSRNVVHVTIKDE